MSIAEQLQTLGRELELKQESIETSQKELAEATAEYETAQANLRKEQAEYSAMIAELRKLTEELATTSDSLTQPSEDVLNSQVADVLKLPGRVHRALSAAGPITVREILNIIEKLKPGQIPDLGWSGIWQIKLALIEKDLWTD